jgi:hypothetical protein
MSQIIVTMHVLCEDERTAQQVITEYFPNAGEMTGLPGILGVKQEWVADAGVAAKFQGMPVPRRRTVGEAERDEMGG